MKFRHDDIDCSVERSGAGYCTRVYLQPAGSGYFSIGISIGMPSKGYPSVQEARTFLADWVRARPDALRGMH